MSIQITIPLAPVTKKNSQRILINRKTGTPFVMPSVKYEKYQKEAAYYLLRGDQKIKPVADYPVNVKCLFYMPTHRRVDLTNLLEAVDDLLVHYGVIADDSYKYVAGHDGSRVLYDKENPRTEIEISHLNAVQIHKWFNHNNSNWGGGGYTECGACGYGFAWGAFFEVDEFDYCPHCGALMEKRRREEGDL